MAAAIWVRVPLFGRFLLQTPVMISGQFYSKSASQLQAFLNSEELLRHVPVRDLSHREKAPCDLQHEKREWKYLYFL